MSYLWYWPSGGWDFDAWRATCTWRPVEGSQSGEAELVRLVDRGQTLDEWLLRKAKIAAVVTELLGRVEDTPPAEPEWEVLETHADPALVRRRLRYRLTPREWGYAWLLMPRNAIEPLPAVIALHQTVPDGKDEPVGLNVDPERAYGRELAERGFAVLVPDAIGFGERAKDHWNSLYRSADGFFAVHPEGSVMAKMAYDTSRAVDLLQVLPGTDASRVGCIGHSHGGYGTLFAMMADERIGAGVISCGISGFRSDPTPERWWRMTALIPRLGLYEGRIAEIPIDFHHLLALVAPRPLFVSAALRDAIFPNTENVRQMLKLVRPVYELYGAEGWLRSWVFDGDHCFPRQARSRAYRVLAEALGPSASKELRGGEREEVLGT